MQVPPAGLSAHTAVHHGASRARIKAAQCAFREAEATHTKNVQLQNRGWLATAVGVVGLAVSALIPMQVKVPAMLLSGAVAGGGALVANVGRRRTQESAQVQGDLAYGLGAAVEDKLTLQGRQLDVPADKLPDLSLRPLGLSTAVH